MIECTACGANNPDPSRFCAECGALLFAQSDVRCPMCGTLNPVGVEACYKCTARLVPLSASASADADAGRVSPRTSSPSEAEAKGPSQGAEPPPGAKPPGEQGDEGSEGWLSQLRATALSEAEAFDATGETASAAEEGVAPAWLSDPGLIDLDARTAPAPGAQPAEDVPAPEDSTPAETPGWMRALRTDGPAEDEPASQDSRPAETPGWMRALRRDGPAEDEPAAEPEEVAGWLEHVLPSQEDIEEVSSVREAPLEPAEVPDWLQEMAPAEAAPAAPEVVPEAPAAPAVGEPAPEAAEIPDWLQEMAPAEAAPAAPAQLAPELAELPEWLDEVVPPGEVEQELPPEEEEEALPKDEEGLTLAGVPDWLQQPQPAEEAPPAEAPPAGAAEAELGPPFREPPLEPAEVPQWLQEIAPAEAAEAEPGLPPEAEKLAPEPAEVPEWLQEIAPAEAAEAEPGLPPEAEKLALEPAEVPEWLQEIVPTESPPFREPALERAEIPEWLQEIAPAEAPPAEAPPPDIAVSGEELPLGQALAADAVAAELAEQPAEPEFPVLMPDDMAARPAPDEVREWAAALESELANLSVTGEALEVEPLPPFVEAEAGLTEPEGLARAEIPAWLEALRPGEEAAEEGVLSEPAETEGVLEGLRGVLPRPPDIAITAAGEVAQPPLSEEVGRARAELLHRLLTEPPPALRLVKREPGVTTGERLQRLLVKVVILVAVAGALLAPYLLGDVPALVQLPRRMPAADSLFDIIEGVAPGDDVLLAFEYGPAEADELDLVAEPILHQILDRGGRVLAASTRPEGLAVAANVLDSVSPPLEAEQYDLQYQPGDATGVRQLLQMDPALVVVLAARPAPLRWWVEQAHAMDDAPPVVAGVSSALEPAASPYLDSHAGQLAGAVSGVVGAAYYEQKVSLDGGRAARRIDALAAGHAVIVSLIVLGAVFSAIGKRAQER